MTYFKAACHACLSVDKILKMQEYDLQDIIAQKRKYTNGNAGTAKYMKHLKCGGLLTRQLLFHKSNIINCPFMPTFSRSFDILLHAV